VIPAGCFILAPDTRGELGNRAEESPMASEAGALEAGCSDRRKFWLELGVAKPAGPLLLAELVESIGLLRFLNAGVVDDGCKPDSKKSSNLGVE
jgi:hypothetical protein